MLNYDIIKKIIPEPIRNVVSKRLPPIDSSGIVKPISERTANRVLDCLRNTNIKALYREQYQHSLKPV